MEVPQLLDTMDEGNTQKSRPVKSQYHAPVRYEMLLQPSIQNMRSSMVEAIAYDLLTPVTKGHVAGNTYQQSIRYMLQHGNSNYTPVGKSCDWYHHLSRKSYESMRFPSDGQRE